MKLVEVIYLSNCSLHADFVECNVHIDYHMCQSIDVLIVVALILLTWRNCLSLDIDEIISQSTKLSLKLVRIIYLSEDLIHTRFARCNVHIIYRICASINVLVVVTLILLIWRNCLSHDTIDLMFSEFIQFRRRNRFSQNFASISLHRSSNWTSFNNASRSHETLIVKKRRIKLIASKRSWKKMRNNVTSVHQIQHLTELTSI